VAEHASKSREQWKLELGRAEEESDPYLEDEDDLYM